MQNKRSWTRFWKSGRKCNGNREKKSPKDRERGNKEKRSFRKKRNKSRRKKRSSCKTQKKIGKRKNKNSYPEKRRRNKIWISTCPIKNQNWKKKRKKINKKKLNNRRRRKRRKRKTKKLKKSLRVSTRSKLKSFRRASMRSLKRKRKVRSSLKNSANIKKKLRRNCGVKFLLKIAKLSKYDRKIMKKSENCIILHKFHKFSSILSPTLKGYSIFSSKTLFYRWLNALIITRSSWKLGLTSAFHSSSIPTLSIPNNWWIFSEAWQKTSRFENNISLVWTSKSSSRLSWE